ITSAGSNYNGVCTVPAMPQAVYLLSVYPIMKWAPQVNWTSPSAGGAIKPNLFTYGPVLTGVTPTSLSRSGGTLITVSGYCFGYNVSEYTHFSVEGLSAIYPTDAGWVSMTDTSLVIKTPYYGYAAST